MAVIEVTTLGTSIVQINVNPSPATHFKYFYNPELCHIYIYANH